MGAIIMNEFNEYVRETFSAVGDVVIRAMMGGYLVYFNGKLIGDICGNELFLKRTPTKSADTLRLPWALKIIRQRYQQLYRRFDLPQAFKVYKVNLLSVSFQHRAGFGVLFFRGKAFDFFDQERHHHF